MSSRDYEPELYNWRTAGNFPNPAPSPVEKVPLRSGVLPWAASTNDVTVCTVAN